MVGLKIFSGYVPHVMRLSRSLSNESILESIAEPERSLRFASENVCEI